MLADAIGHYHDLLQRDALADDSQAQLDRLTQLRGLSFGDRPVCTVLRPRFLTTSHYRFLTTRVQALLPAFAKVYRRALADATFRRQFGLFDWEEELQKIEPGFDDPS